MNGAQNLPASDESLLSHCHSLVIRDLPGLNVRSTQGANAMMIGKAIGDVTDKLKAIRQDAKAEDREKEENRLQKRFGHTTLTSLCNLCQIDAPEDLLVVYHQLAGADNKSQERQVLQNAVEEVRKSQN